MGVAKTKRYTSSLSQVQVLEEMEELRYLQWLLYVQVLMLVERLIHFIPTKSHHIIDSCLCHQIICAEVSMHHPQNMQGLQYGIASCIPILFGKGCGNSYAWETDFWDDGQT